MITPTAKVTTGKTTKDGKQTIVIKDTYQQRVVEADKSKVDSFLKEKDELTSSYRAVSKIGSAIGGLAFVGTFIALFSKSIKNIKHPVLAGMGLAFLGCLTGSSIAQDAFGIKHKVALQDAFDKLTADDAKKPENTKSTSEIEE